LSPGSELTNITEPARTFAVAEIHGITKPGSFHFGGGELKPTGSEPYLSARRNPDDEYEWWVPNAG
jgi:hypothetical protein